MLAPPACSGGFAPSLRSARAPVWRGDGSPRPDCAPLFPLAPCAACRRACCGLALPGVAGQRPRRFAPSPLRRSLMVGGACLWRVPPSLDIAYLLRAILPGVGPLVAPFGRSFSSSAAPAGRARARTSNIRAIYHLRCPGLIIGFISFPFLALTSRQNNAMIMPRRVFAPYPVTPATVRDTGAFFIYNYILIYFP